MGEVPPPEPSRLDQPVSVLWGVGDERAIQLTRLKIHSVRDVLLHRPRRYEDRRHFKPIAELTRETATLSRGTVVAMGVKRFRRGAKSVFELVLDDGSARLHCRWWNLPFMENYFAVGNEVLVFGKLREQKPRTMDHPETEVVESDAESSIHMNRIVPVYPLSEGIPQRWLRGLIWRTLDRHHGDVAEPFDVGLTNGLPSRAEAIRMLHCPGTIEEAETGRQRLALDEMVVLQKEIRRRRLRFEARSNSLPCRGDNHLIKPFLAALGFKLTDAQTRVLRQIRDDMGRAHPMRRLLQGDVGSGKTAVAACTALMALESGYDVLLMAPTEILAEQHFRNFDAWLTSLGIQVHLQTGSRKTRGQDSKEVSQPERASLMIGTHALLESGVAMDNLGLVIVDEQHKFGVTQRERLVRKGHYPHLLVMTATPIPRTLGLTLYGDLDVSVIDELPAGRGKVRTFIREARALPKVWEFVREKLDAGRQAYVVYPRVSETSGGTTKAVLREFERVKSALKPHAVELLHGRLKAREKELAMTGFREGRVKVLVATSLIEVGVDVPNATVLVIENAEQFGLAQLHQLRGRIGRGAHESHCILVSDAKTPETRKRLGVLEETSDGFRIAEADLGLRGPGELLGQQQSGSMRLRFTDLGRDLALVELARAITQKIPVSGEKRPDP